MSYETKIKPPKAVLFSILLPTITDAENSDSLKELARLAHTLGYEVLTTLSQRRSSLATGTVLGAGKLKVLAQLTGGTGLVKTGASTKKHKAAEKWEVNISAENDNFPNSDADLDSFDDNTLDEEIPDNNTLNLEKPKEKADIVIFDGELTPSQCANLESATGKKVLDRTGLIVEIFSKHAKTRESRLQIEIARLNYLSPRIRETGTGSGDRVEGKVGESKLELDRRKIRDRIAELHQELAQIQKDQSRRREIRNEKATVALVGYTNAGKSSLMRALTGSQVLVQDKLFATLDTTVRSIFPETRPKILVSDTVGFIKKLPHDLVASFRSTLEEAKNASLLLFVVDASDSTFRAQLRVTHLVLSEIGVENVPQKLILNKVDKLNEDEINALLKEFPDAIPISTLNKNDVAALIKKIIEFFEKDMIECEVFVPYTTQGAIGEIKQNIKILSEDYDEIGVTFKLLAEEKYLKKLKKKFNLNGPAEA